MRSGTIPLQLCNAREEISPFAPSAPRQNHRDVLSLDEFHSGPKSIMTRGEEAILTLVRNYKSEERRRIKHVDASRKEASRGVLERGGRRRNAERGGGLEGGNSGKRSRVTPPIVLAWLFGSWHFTAYLLAFCFCCLP